MDMKRYFFKGLIASVFSGLFLLVAGLAYIAFPWSSPQPIPSTLRPQYEPLSETFLSSTLYAADYPSLLQNFEGQQYRSYCGVASSVIVLKALGFNTRQTSFFSNPKVDQVRPFFKIFFTGMPLSDLNGILQAYGASTRLYYASDIDTNSFRDILKDNMRNPENFLIVNYLRSTLGQDNVGHISPIGAFDPETDEVLLMDVTTYNYPPVWVKVPDLFAAMNTMDDTHSRGLVEVF